MEMKMNKEEYIKVLMVKTNRSEEECIVLNEIIEKHFITIFKFFAIADTK